MPWPTPHDSNEPDLWERQRRPLSVGWLRRALGEAPEDAIVVLGFYDGLGTELADPVDITMETSSEGAVRVVITGATISTTPTA